MAHGHNQDPQNRTIESQQRRSFEVLASVDMFRYDLDRFGAIQNETRERVCDEELSYLVEAVDRASCTSFTLKREGENLVYFKDGAWRPYIGMLITGQQVARREAADDPRRLFLLHNANDDLINGYKMNSLKPGESHSWFASYDHQAGELHGPAFMRGCGMKPDRKMGFIYQARCELDGSVVLESQTVDQSDREGFAAAMNMARLDPEADTQVLVAAYDNALMKKHGGYFFAGRRDAKDKENAWRVMEEQRDLIEYHLDKLEVFAESSAPRYQLEDIVKRHIIGVWGMFKERIDTQDEPVPGQQVEYIAGSMFNPINEHLYREMEQAVQQKSAVLYARGEMPTGCGGSITMKSFEEMTLEESYNAIFGGSSKSSEKYSFNKKMYCVVCQAPPKEKASKKDCGPCGLCRTCDKKAGGKG